MSDPHSFPRPPAHDRGPVLIAAALIGAALIVSWRGGDDGQRYQIAGTGDAIVRLDTESGEMLACNRQSCVRVEAPTQEKRFGPLGVVVNDTPKSAALPPPAPANDKAR